MADPLLRVSDVARRLSVSRSTVCQLARDGRLASVRLGPQLVRFRPADVDAFVERSRIPTGIPVPMPLRDSAEGLSGASLKLFRRLGGETGGAAQSPPGATTKRAAART